jgi:hypothetical protein
MSWLAFGTTFRVTVGYLRAGTSSFKELLEEFSELVCDFKEASRNFILNSLHKKAATNLVTLSL